MDNISQNEKLSTIVKALDSKRAEDIRIIEIGDLTIVADYFVIAKWYFKHSDKGSCGGS